MGTAKYNGSHITSSFLAHTILSQDRVSKEEARKGTQGSFSRCCAETQRHKVLRVMHMVGIMSQA